MINVELQKYIETFKSIEFEYKENGMFGSELFIVYSLYRELGCNSFIESGLDNGASTKKLLLHIHEDYLGIDVNNNCLAKNLIKFNFKFVCGDSSKIIFDVVENEKKDKDLFILIDGPKGGQAINMKNRLLEYPNVKVVALHDTYDGLEHDNRYRVFETRSNIGYNEKYFKLMNGSEDPSTLTVYNLRNNGSDTTYVEDYPTGPGVSIYSKLELNFIL